MSEKRDSDSGEQASGAQESREQLVLLEKRGPVAVVTLNRPHRYNAFDEVTLEVMAKRFVSVSRDPAIRAMVLTGTGNAFCTGGDLKSVTRPGNETAGDRFYAYASVFHQCVEELRTMPKPVIGAINGPAAGGGLSLVLACDLRVMARSAFLQQSYTSNGLSIDGGGTFSLPRLVGLARALEIALLDERIGSERALELGLVTRLAEDSKVVEDSLDLARRLASGPTETFSRVKRLLVESFDTPLERQLEKERQHLAESADSAVGREGLAAFVEKRSPRFDAL